MIQVEVPYGEVCPNKNIKVSYDMCKECGSYKSLSKTFVTCHLNNNTLQMTKEAKELLLKDLCARLPYSIKLHHYQGADCTLKYFNPITFATYVEVKNSEYFKEFLEDGQRSLFEYKPYLRPMSSMTEKEKEEWHDTFDSVYDLVPGGDPDNEDDYDDNWHEQPGIESYDYLITHHFDYRGLIPKGLAIEAPEDMYK